MYFIFYYFTVTSSQAFEDSTSRICTMPKRQMKRPAATAAAAPSQSASDQAWASAYDGTIPHDKIPCKLCERDVTFASWAGLAAHLRRSHRKTRKDFVGTYIQARVEHEKAPITLGERTCVKPDPDGDEDKFLCCLCTEPTPPSKANERR